MIKLSCHRKILIFHLKRYYFDPESERTKKANARVNFPSDQGLWWPGSIAEEKAQYNLVAVIYHRGEDAVSSGHYAITMRIRQSWVMFDDDKVVEMAKDHDLISEGTFGGDAFMLVYCREDQYKELIDQDQHKHLQMT